MSALSILPLSALIASIVLLVQNANRRLAVVAFAASAVEVILAFGIVHFSVRGLSLGLIFGAVLAVVGGLIFSRVHRKSAVSAATLIAFVGVVQVIAALHIG